MPLALGAMFQQSGRVLDLEDRISFWQKFSPFVCATDMLALVIALVIDYTAAPSRTLDHFKSELVWRFRDYDIQEQSSTDVGKRILVRWMLMILAGVPLQTIKLFAMHGIPFTQAVALLFLLFQLVGEALNLSAVIIYHSTQPPAAHSLNLPSRRNIRWLEILANNSHLVQTSICCWVITKITLDIFSLPLGYFAHGVSILSPLLLRSLFTPPGVRLPVWLGLNWECPGLNTRFHLLSMGFSAFVCVSLLTSIYAIDKISPRFPNLPILPALLLVLLLVYLSFFLVAFFGCMLGLCLIHIFTFVVSRYLTFIIVVAMWISSGLEWCWNVIAHSRIAMIALRVLGLPEDKDERDAMSAFFLHIVVAIIGYCYVFDSTGTVNPSWVGVFG